MRVAIKPAVVFAKTNLATKGTGFFGVDFDRYDGTVFGQIGCRYTDFFAQRDLNIAEKSAQGLLDRLGTESFDRARRQPLGRPRQRCGEDPA